MAKKKRQKKFEKTVRKFQRDLGNLLRKSQQANPNSRANEENDLGGRGVGNDRLTVLLEEFKQSRAEINIKQKHIHAITNFALLIMIATSGALASTNELKVLHYYVMLLTPIVLSLIGFLFAYEGELMAVASGYINSVLRPQIAKELSRRKKDVMPWEDFKREHSPVIWLLYDLARWLIFVVPSLALLVAFVQVSPPQGVKGGVALLVTGWVLNSLLILLFFHRLVYKARVLFKPNSIVEN